MNGAMNGDMNGHMRFPVGSHSKAGAYGERNSITAQELNECDREEFKYIGHIQGGAGHVLFFTDGYIVAADMLIQSVPWIKVPNPQLGVLGLHLDSCIPEDLSQAIAELVNDMQDSKSQRSFHFYQHQGISYALSLSAVTIGNYNEIGMEIEELDVNETQEKFFNTTTNLARVMEFYTNESITSAACDSVFRLLGGYGRGLVYRFNDDSSGEVIHEIRSDELASSYMGLRCPASDIPLPARKLYITNGLRYIYGIEDDPVPIVCEAKVQNVDLSQCRMRAVAKCHILYLRNMGVQCSLSLSIVIEGELWGLMCFHGYGGPFKPSLHQRIACEMITSMVSVRIEALLKREQSSRIIRMGHFMMGLDQEQSVIQNLHKWSPDILKVLDADVLVGRMQDPREGEGHQIVIGDKSLAPAASFWKKMVQFDNRELCVLSTRREIEDRGITLRDSPSCGFVYFRENRMHIFVGRTERSSDVAWAGNPDEPMLRIGGILNPRASFNHFMEKARMESRAWSKQDVNVISSLRDRLCEHAYKYMMYQLQHDIEDTNEKYVTAIDRARENYEFFAHMSHELRTPFHGVMGCLQILQDSIDGMTKEEMTDTVKTAISSGNHMLNLLNDILDISKNKHLSHECAKNTFLYQAFAHEALDGMRTLAQSRGIKMECIVSPKDGHDVIVTDRTKVIQIVSNTVNNAIKFTKQGEIHVQFDLVDSFLDSVELWDQRSASYEGTVVLPKEGTLIHDVDSLRALFSQYQRDRSTKWINVSVTDSGRGMNPAKLAEMFSPYTQESIASNRTFQGTGLGLYICLSLCQLLQGFIACATTPQLGSMFHCAIPVGLCENPAEMNGNEDIGASQPIGSSILMSGPILVVDDNKVNIKILERQLRMEIKKTGKDFSISTARGGQEAIDLYQQVQPSLCIIDYHMPDIDGLAATERIREIERELAISPTFIVFYTADATITIENVREKGVDEIMSKPPPKGYIATLAQRLVDSVSI